MEKENPINYHIPATVEEQKRLAEMELQQFQQMCADGIAFRKGMIRALELIQKSEPIVRTQ